MSSLTVGLTPTFNGYDSPDFHTWVEVEDGEILDYPIKTLKPLSKYGTDRVKYAPFAEKHQKRLCDKYVYNLSVKYIACGETRYKNSLEETFTTNGGYCPYRAIIIQNRLFARGIKSKIVFGSLGFIQKDGSVFYEFG